MPATGEPPPPSDPTQLERARIFFGHASGNLVSFLVGGVIVGLVLSFAGTSRDIILAWECVLLTGMAAVWLQERQVRRTGLRADNFQRFLRSRIILGGSLSLIYGVTAFLMPNLNTHSEHTFLFLVMVTLVTTATLGYSVMPAYYLTVNALSIGPVTACYLYLYLTDHDNYYLLLVSVSVVWQVIVLKKALAMSKTVIRNITLNQRLQQEIEENARARDAINHMAMHDDLTGLANRRYFEQTFARTLSQAHRTQTFFGVLSIDLNDFKPVNDTYGHATGDHLLKIVAERLGHTTRASDFCARIGGDEFAVLCTSIRSVGDLQEITHKLKRELGRPFEPDDNLVTTSASIGWALYPEDGDTITRLLACADQRMYADKQSYKSRPAPLS